MAVGLNGYRVAPPVFTVGETIGDYTPPGVLDGLGAFKLNANTVRVLANHELLHNLGYEYTVSGSGMTLLGARISYFDVDVHSREVVASGLAYDYIYDANGDLATDDSFLTSPYAPFFGGPETAARLQGFSRFCSSGLFEPREFGPSRGFRNRIYLTGEEDGGGFNSIGGAMWGLDPESKSLYHLPDLGRGGWENVTALDTGEKRHVALLLADDTEPFDFDGDDVDEAAPLFLYIGRKKGGDFAARNGLRDGTLYVWVSDTGELSPADFNGAGTLSGTWVEIDNSPTGPASSDGTSGFDQFGYPTQATLWTRAEAVGAFGFSRPEDVATNPFDGTEAVLASTGVDTFVGGVDTFGTMYTIKTDFETLTADLTILYDGDADPTRALRSPDNLDWADDGFIYVQEDEAEEDTLSGEVLFGDDAANPNEAGIVRIDPWTGELMRVANINRSVVLDGSLADSTAAVDGDAGDAGEWETSGIIDVSLLFGWPLGSLFLFDVQAHGIEDQTDINPESRINDNDLVEGGQLLFLSLPPNDEGDDVQETPGADPTTELPNGEGREG